MAQREAYVRAVVEQGDGEFIGGLELRTGDDVPLLREVLRKAIKLVVDRTAISGGNELDLALRVEKALKLLWPDRAYFLEVCHNPNEGWVQLFQPYGLPRTDAPQTEHTKPTRDMRPASMSPVQGLAGYRDLFSGDDR